MCYSVSLCCLIDSMHKYFFMIDRGQGITIFHPKLPNPLDEDETPVSLRVHYLENDANKAGIIDSMLRFDEASRKKNPDSPGIPYT